MPNTASSDSRLQQRNLALEALRKLVNGQLRSRSKVNVVETKAFSERLEEAVAHYHSNAITTAQVIQELIQVAKDIQAARARGEEQGLSEDEMALHDLLVDNASAALMSHLGRDRTGVGLCRYADAGDLVIRTKTRALAVYP